MCFFFSVLSFQSQFTDLTHRTRACYSFIIFTGDVLHSCRKMTSNKNKHGNDIRRCDPSNGSRYVAKKTYWITIGLKSNLRVHASSFLSLFSVFACCAVPFPILPCCFMQRFFLFRHLFFLSLSLSLHSFEIEASLERVCCECVWHVNFHIIFAKHGNRLQLSHVVHWLLSQRWEWNEHTSDMI